MGFQYVRFLDEDQRVTQSRGVTDVQKISDIPASCMTGRLEHELIAIDICSGKVNSMTMSLASYDAVDESLKYVSHITFSQLIESGRTFFPLVV